jgi:cupin fold WbuC family metalloprotein
MLKIIDENFMNKMSLEAKASTRKRVHHNIHKTLDEQIHRLVIAAEPETYMRPHRHTDKWELLTLLRGSASIIIFNDNGTISSKITLSESSDGAKSLEIPAGLWHVFFVNDPDTILIEVKSGPYLPIEEKDFANWAPPENTSNIVKTLNFYKTSKINDKYYK